VYRQIISQEKIIADLQEAINNKHQVYESLVINTQNYELEITRKNEVINSLTASINNILSLINESDNFFKKLIQEHLYLDSELARIIASSSYLKAKMMSSLVYAGRGIIKLGKKNYRYCIVLSNRLSAIISTKKWRASLIQFIEFNLHDYFSVRLGRLLQYPPREIDLRQFTSNIRPNSLMRVSIITPSLNQGAYISKTIESVISQNYQNLEYIVQDGASLDETPRVLNHYVNQITKINSHIDRGQTHAINLGMSLASGDIMAWLNSDDILLPGAIDAVIAFFEMNPHIDVVYGWRIIIDEAGREVGRWVLPPHSNEILKWVDYVPQETLFWRRSLWEKVACLDENFKFAMDWDLLLRFIECGAQFACIPRFIGGFRVHAMQKTSSIINTTGLKEMSALRLRSLGRVPKPLEIEKKIRGYTFKHQLADLKWRLSINRIGFYKNP